MVFNFCKSLQFSWSWLGTGGHHMGSQKEWPNCFVNLMDLGQAFTASSEHMPVPRQAIERNHYIWAISLATELWALVSAEAAIFQLSCSRWLACCSYARDKAAGIHGGKGRHWLEIWHSDKPAWLDAATGWRLLPPLLHLLLPRSPGQPSQVSSCFICEAHQLLISSRPHLPYT